MRSSRSAPSINRSIRWLASISIPPSKSKGQAKVNQLGRQQPGPAGAFESAARKRRRRDEGIQAPLHHPRLLLAGSSKSSNSNKALGDAQAIPKVLNSRLPHPGHRGGVVVRNGGLLLGQPDAGCSASLQQAASSKSSAFQTHTPLVAHAPPMTHPPHTLRDTAIDPTHIPTAIDSLQTLPPQTHRRFPVRCRPP